MLQHYILSMPNKLHFNNDLNQGCQVNILKNTYL